MKFRDMTHLNMWLEYHKEDILGSGAQGTCFRVENKVYKIFNEFYDKYGYDQIIYDRNILLQFSDIINNTYIWPLDVIMVGNIVVGYMYDYVNGRDLCGINPLSINLDKFDKNLRKVPSDIKIISDYGVETYDVMYNILYGNKGFYVIDSLEYMLSNIDGDQLFKINARNFNNEIKLFLTYDYFDKFIQSNSLLREMYFDSDTSSIEFLKEFRKKLSEFEGYEIQRLGDARGCVSYTRRRDLKYIRSYRSFVD